MLTGKLIFQLFSRQLAFKVSQNSKKSVFGGLEVNKSLNFTQRYNFSQRQQPLFTFNLQHQVQLLKLELQYRSQQNIGVFQDSIKTSTGVMDQMNIYKIFKVMQSSLYNHDSYQQFFDHVDTNIKKKSDNMLMLLATVKERMSRSYRKQKDSQNALKSLQQALDIMQSSRVPPLFYYYSIYREYGLLHDQLGEKQKAKQILAESVEILHDFVSHSDDNVSTNDYCKKQATSYNVLSRLDPQNRKKWTEQGIQMWQKFTQNRYNQIQYAKTVAQSLKYQLKQDKQKGQAYYNFNLYKFENKQMKDILKRAKQQAN